MQQLIAGHFMKNTFVWFDNNAQCLIYQFQVKRGENNDVIHLVGHAAAEYAKEHPGDKTENFKNLVGLTTRSFDDDTHEKEAHKMTTAIVSDQNDNRVLLSCKQSFC